MQSVVGIAKHFINLIYPLRCAACKKDLDPLDESGVCNFCIGEIRPNPKPHCKSCGRSLESARSPICAECKRTLFSFERAYSACRYEGVLKELIGQFKYKRKIYLSKILSRLMVDFIKENKDLLEGIDFITFVPLHKSRQKMREFNQSKVLAANLSNEFGIPLIDALIKTRSTRPQNELSREKRLSNLKDTFRTKDAIFFNDMRLLLVDDVMTTGATLNECARVLLDSGAASVRCLTLARGM